MAVPRRVGHEFALVADQATGWRMEHQALAAGAGGAHVAHFGAALGQLLHHDAGIGLINVDNHFFDGFQPLAMFIGAEHHAGAAHGEFEAFAAHGFNQDAQLQFAAARHFKGIGFIFR